MKSNPRVRVAVIGATGSVGSAVLDICGRFPDKIEVAALAASSNEKKLVEMGRKYGASILCLSNSAGKFKEEGFKCFVGNEALEDIASGADVDHVVFASSGVAAIKALQAALTADKDVSLANKESIVVAGPWVMPLVKRKGQLRPVDSEHSAVWQCLREDAHGEVRKVWLTASGGPFKNFAVEEMKNIRPCDALKHPVWKMGAKITIDSATLMNKGIECIEAMRLFDLPADNVGALIHPKSQVHGMVLFCDGTMKMLLSPADMRFPGAAALAWPSRFDLMASGMDYLRPCELDLRFSEIDEERFPCFRTARDAGKKGGAYPALLIGADEAAVSAFLKEEIAFTDIARVVVGALESWNGRPPASLDDALSLVEYGRRAACEICKKRWNRI